MKFVIENTDIASGRKLAARIIRTLDSIPGTGDLRRELRKQMDEEIDVVEIQRALDPMMVTIAREGDDVVIWVSPEAVDAVNDIYGDYIDAVAEIAIAAYPMIRLAKRLFNGIGDKLAQLGAKFAAKPDARLGTVVPVRLASSNDTFDGPWREGEIVATCGETVLIRQTGRGAYATAAADGALYYSKLSSFVEFDSPQDAAFNLMRDSGVEFAA